jgi:pimeloyl-ACP methyl ester carboxylesterase
MYPRLAPATARALTRRLRPMAAPADGSPVGDHPDVPTAFVYATDDEFFAPASQRSIARGTLGIEPIEIPGGHFPMVEDSDALAHLLDRLALEHAA